ncbi:MAG: hypothetical protein WC488_03240 [Candidatus Micrarchaeia archaeon]
MDEHLKLLNKAEVEFRLLNPMVELSVPVQSFFPTMLAINAELMAEKTKEAGLKMHKLVENTKGFVGKSERQQSSFQKPDKQEIAKGETETKTYCLVYFNPETRKSEIVEGEVSLQYEDETQQVIEEGLGQRSAYNIYSYIATPMIKEYVDEAVLREIMDKIKIESPDPFGGGSAVIVAHEDIKGQVAEKKEGEAKAEAAKAQTVHSAQLEIKSAAAVRQAEIVAVQPAIAPPIQVKNEKMDGKKAEIVAVHPIKINYAALDKKTLEKYGEKIIALEVAEKRRIGVEEQLSTNIVVVDSVVRKLELPGADRQKLVEALPVLTRARVKGLIRKNKRTTKKQIRDFLLKDSQFLRAVKTKVGAMRVTDIFKAVLKLK